MTAGESLDSSSSRDFPCTAFQFFIIFIRRSLQLFLSYFHSFLFGETLDSRWREGGRQRWYYVCKKVNKIIAKNKFDFFMLFLLTDTQTSCVSLHERGILSVVYELFQDWLDLMFMQSMKNYSVMLQHLSYFHSLSVCRFFCLSLSLSLNLSRFFDWASRLLVCRCWGLDAVEIRQELSNWDD